MQEKLPSPLRVERRGDVAQLVMCDQEGRNSLDWIKHLTVALHLQVLSVSLR